MKDRAESADPKKIVESGYDRCAPEYARLEGKKPWPRMRWLNKLLAQLEPGSSVLDIGCGSGDPADIEIAKLHSVTGIDISQAQLDMARENVPDGRFLHGDAGSLEFPLSSFDAVVSFYTMEHIPRREHHALLNRIHLWLRKRGYLLISIEAGDYDDVTGDWLGVPMFISCYDPQTTKGLIRDAGFEILDTAIEVQIEQDHDVPYLWVIARKEEAGE